MKRKVTILIYAALLLLFTLSVHGQTDSEIIDSDSLQEIIESNPPGSKARLKALCELAFTEQNTVEGISFSQLLLHEAKSPKDDKYIYRAAYYLSIYHFNKDNEDSLSYYIDFLSPLAEKEQDWEIYFEALMLRINLNIFNGNYEQAIRYAHYMLDKANRVKNADAIIGSYLCLATAYLSTHQLEETREMLFEARRLLQESEEKNLELSANVLLSLIVMSHEEKNVDMLWQYLQEMKMEVGILTERDPELEDNYDNLIAFLEIYYANYYILTVQPEKAYEHLQRAEQCIDENVFFGHTTMYNEACADYYVLQDNPGKALEHLNVAIQSMTDSSALEYYRLLEKKADLLAAYRRYDEALPLYRQASLAIDSIMYKLSNEQMEQILLAHQLDQLFLENEKVKNQKQRALLIFSVGLLVLLTIFVRRTLQVRKRLKISKERMREAAEVAAETGQMKERFFLNMSQNIRTPLNTVVGYSQLLTDSEIDEASRKDYSFIIKQKSEELIRLVNNVLDLSRLESGMMKFTLQEYDASILCQEAIYMVNSKMDNSVTVCFEPYKEPLLISGDISRLGQTLVTMLAFTTPDIETKGKRTINLSVEMREENAVFQITGSLLAETALANQEITIQNEINKLFFKRFGGTYRIQSADGGKSSIIATYPMLVK